MILSPGAILLTFWQLIQPADSWLITHINQQWGNPVFDTVLPYLRETMFWLPLYLFLLVFAIANFGRQAIWFIAGAALAAILSDLVSSQLIKEHIFRLRPCRDPEIAQHIRFFINYCPQSSSFTSSHATSHFAQATFFFVTLRPVIGRWARLFFLWAFAIAYTQVYVGVHYPFDVLCGSLLGVGIGFMISRIFNNQIGTLTVS